MFFALQSHSFFSTFTQVCKHHVLITDKYLKFFKIQNVLIIFNQKYSSNEVCSFTNHLYWIKLIRKYTVISRSHLTPEIQLHLITPNCELWTADNAKSPFKDPFWSFYWPGGQSLSRYITFYIL